jgi:pectate lyase
MDTAINTRMGAQMLVQSNVFKNVAVPVTSRFSDEVGWVSPLLAVFAQRNRWTMSWWLTCMGTSRYAKVIDTDLGGGVNDAPVGTMTPTSVGYSYSLIGSAGVAAKVPREAGAILSF